MGEVHRLFPDEQPESRQSLVVDDERVVKFAKHIADRLPDRRQVLAAILLSPTLSNDEAFTLMTQTSLGITPDGSVAQPHPRRTFTPGQDTIG